jgi:hypothetical protein
LILLSGLKPDEDIKIEFTGMPEGDMLAWLDCLREICEARDAGRLVVTLKEIVLDYSPSTHLLKRVIEPRRLARHHNRSLTNTR